MVCQLLDFTVIGERCSGTNFLEAVIRENFHLNSKTYKYGFNKHFFMTHDFEKARKDNNTIYFAIVRDPITWINSFFKEKWHIPPINHDIQNFLENKFYSVYDNGKEIIEDRNLDGKRFDNIFHLRKVKNDFLINVMPTKIQHYILIRYEDLLMNYEITLQNIKDKFGISMKHESFVKINSYKGFKSQPFKIKPLDLSPVVIQKIWSNLDHDQEKILGYL